MRVIKAYALWILEFSRISFGNFECNCILKVSKNTYEQFQSYYYELNICELFDFPSSIRQLPNHTSVQITPYYVPRKIEENTSHISERPAVSSLPAGTYHASTYFIIITYCYVKTG